MSATAVECVAPYVPAPPHNSTHTSAVSVFVQALVRDDDDMIVSLDVTHTRTHQRIAYCGWHYVLCVKHTHEGGAAVNDFGTKVQRHIAIVRNCRTYMVNHI